MESSTMGPFPVPTAVRMKPPARKAVGRNFVGVTAAGTDGRNLDAKYCKAG